MSTISGTISGVVSGAVSGLAANLPPRLSEKLLGRRPPGVQWFSNGELPSLAGDGVVPSARSDTGPGTGSATGPVARTLSRIKSPDGYFVSGLWDCTAGTLEITFDFDELVHILEGEVTVRAEGADHVLLPGSVAFFPNGLVTSWEIPRYLRKMYVHRYPRHNLAWRAARRLIRVVR